MYQEFKSHLQTELTTIEQAGLYKNERIIVSPQGAVIRVADGKEVLNFCANNYLGLSNNPTISPCFTLMETSFTTVRLPYFLNKFSVRSTMLSCVISFE